MRAFLPFLLFLALICGCQNTRPTADEMEPQIKAGIDKTQQEGGKEPTKSVSLVESSPNHYEGFAELSDGSRIPIVVTRQDDGQTIWRVVK